MANPVLNEKILSQLQDSADLQKMTIEGTINKTGLLILFTVAGAVVGWNLKSLVVLFSMLIMNLVLVFMISRKPERAAYLSQVYAVAEGLVLGSISSFYAVTYPGIVSNALLLTMGCLIVMLGLYKFRIVRVNEKFKSMVMAATMAIALTYLVNIVMTMFGTSIPMIHEGSTGGIIFSLVVVGVAAFNLFLDFDLIEQSYLRGAPKYMEWYGGFALLVTIVWLYLEILRLLSKLNKR